VSDSSANDDPYRLPPGVVPVRYDLSLAPDLAAFTFTGSNRIEIDVLRATDTIVLNAIELEIDKAWLDDGAGAERAATPALDESTERLTLTFETAIDVGRHTLHIEFRGTLNDKLHGFYRSTFVDTDGNEQVIATTQMEATDARRAFPCWDEPELKAVFAVTLVVDDDLAAISNAGETTRVPAGDGKVAVSFADTMKMSTYLVAFIVGPLDVTAPVDVDGKPLRVVYPRGKGHLTAYALEVGKFCLEFFHEYYGIVYPGDKLDLVAVPDFAFGAMENLGCVTFREVLLLVDPEQVTQPELQNITDVIAHELAHMWFGDLVTMKWWNGIWLNEAFATFMEMLATDAFRPDWDRWTTFGLSRTAAFDVDSLQTTRPIEFPVISPEDAEGMFDILTYEKGAAVVRMLEQYLGAEEFRGGIRLYLTKHQYGNTETTDLWDALEEATGEPVRAIMDSWIFQGGFPVIDVELVHDDLGAGEATGAGSLLRLTQRRFGYAGDLGQGDEADDADPEVWQVPLIFSMKLRPDPDTEGYITFERQLVPGGGFETQLVEAVDWVLVNTEGTGFYRASYSRELREALAAHAQTDLSPIERYGLIDDAWASVLAGATSVVHYFEFVKGFADEADLSVWERIIGSLVFLDRLVDGDERVALQAQIRELLRPAYDRLGGDVVDGESDRDRELRGSLFEALGVLGADPEIGSMAGALFANEMATAGSVDPSLFAASIGVIAPTMTAATYDVFVDRFTNAATPQDEIRFLYALADADDAELVGRTLHMVMTDAVRTQNAPYLLRRAMANRHHGLRSWKFVVDNWDAINERFPSNSIVRMLEGVRSLHEPSVAETVFSFFTTHEVPQGDKTLAQHLERLEVNVALRRREADAFADSLL
jgi:puromycin-sensitive aminopeptidase